MRSDRSRCSNLGQLAMLQGLRVAQGELALADAAAERAEAEDAEREAERRLDAARQDYRRMLSAGSFAAEGFRLAGAMVNLLECETGIERERSARARDAEAAKELRWQRQRHRQDQLGALHKAARRKLARKEEESSMAETAQLLLHRSGRSQA